MSDKTQREYIRQVEAFASFLGSFLGRSPDTATGDDIRRFQFAQVEQGAQPPKMNAQVSALRFGSSARPLCGACPCRQPPLAAPPKPSTSGMACA